VPDFRIFVGIAARPKPIATPKGNGYQIMQRFGSDRDAMACLAQEMRVRLQSLAWRPDQLDPALDRGIYDRNASGEPGAGVRFAGRPGRGEGGAKASRRPLREDRPIDRGWLDKLTMRAIFYPGGLEDERPH
jgi:hypothetical protein